MHYIFITEPACTNPSAKITPVLPELYDAEWWAQLEELQFPRCRSPRHRGVQSGSLAGHHGQRTVHHGAYRPELAQESSTTTQEMGRGKKGIYSYSRRACGLSLESRRKFWWFDRPTGSVAARSSHLGVSGGPLHQAHTHYLPSCFGSAHRCVCSNQEK